MTWTFCPGRIPRALRTRRGMTTWNFVETVLVSIQASYRKGMRITGHSNKKLLQVQEELGRLTAPSLAEHPCGGAARPAEVVSPRSQTTGWPRSVEDPRPFQGASRSEAEGAASSCSTAAGQMGNGFVLFRDRSFAP